MFYGDADQFLEGTVPFLRGAMEAGEPALAAVGPEQTALLEGELGADASEVLFADMRELGRNPARIIPLWRRFLDERGGGERPVAGIGEPIWPGRSAAEIDECQRHEALLNFAFGGTPAWSLLCPYDSAALEDGVLEAASHCHPFLVDSGGAVANSACAGVASRPEPFAGTLSRPPREAASMRFDRQGLGEVRALVRRHAEGGGLSALRALDLVTAASEVAANSVLHGGGIGSASVWTGDGAVLVEVEDRGLVEEPLIGRAWPEVTQVSGRGVWLANQLCDLVQIRSSAGGTRVRLHMGLS